MRDLPPDAAAAALLQGLTADDAERLGTRITQDNDGDADAAAAQAWLMGARAMRNATLGRQICRICGCWEEEACPPTCAWAEPDLCTACDLLDRETCMACLLILKEDDLVLHDVSGSWIHAACCGPEREAYTNADGEPLGPDDPIPTGTRYGDFQTATASDNG